MNPFLILDVPVTATDDEVRTAYQNLLRRFTPEQRPDEFQLIQEAYQALRTGRDRWRWRLFHLPGERSGPKEALDAFARIPGRARPPGAAAFRSFLGACAAAASRESST